MRNPVAECQSYRKQYCARGRADIHPMLPPLVTCVRRLPRRPFPSPWCGSGPLSVFPPNVSSAPVLP